MRYDPDEKGTILTNQLIASGDAGLRNAIKNKRPSFGPKLNSKKMRNKLENTVLVFALCWAILLIIPSIIIALVTNSSLIVLLFVLFMVLVYYVGYGLIVGIYFISRKKSFESVQARCIGYLYAAPGAGVLFRVSPVYNFVKNGQNITACEEQFFYVTETMPAVGEVVEIKVSPKDPYVIWRKECKEQLIYVIIEAFAPIIAVFYLCFGD